MTNLQFTTPILDEKGLEIEKVDILLSTVDIQELIEKVVRAIELREYDELREFSDSLGLTEPLDMPDFPKL